MNESKMTYFLLLSYLGFLEKRW